MLRSGFLRSRFPRLGLLGAVALALLLARPARAAVTLPLAPEERHQVFVWYMVCFGQTVDFYKQEIELAQRHGIDGFLLDCGEWMQAKGDKLEPTRYVASADALYQAAKELNSGFKLMMAPEYSVQPASPNLEEMLRRFYHHPNQFRCQGKAVLAGYGISGAAVKDVTDKLEREGMPVLFLQAAFAPRYQMAMSLETLTDLFAASPNLDGYMQFACNGPVGRILRDNANGQRVCSRLGRIYTAGVVPAYNSANLSDFHGARGYGAMWEGAIRDNADWVSIITWNDYNEDSGLMPYRWPAGSEKQFFDRDESFLDLTAYYSAWYKSGRQPAISQDKLYTVYRTRGRWQRAAWDAAKNAWIDIARDGNALDQIHDDIEDRVYATAFLTAPAELTLRLGAFTQTARLPAGVSQVEVPLRPGVPEFLLRRAVNGKPAVLADVVGRRQVIAQETKENSPDGKHLLNRTWASGTAIGPVKRLDLSTAHLHPHTTRVKVGATRAALTTEQEGSGVTFPVSGLSTATYNVRILYSNPSADDARLTLLADGSPREGADAYYLPAWLPPTGKGRLAATSFFWSLYDKTTTLRLQWMKGMEWGQPKAAFNDQGSVAIAAIELVKVEPVPVPAARTSIVPQLVALPGGSFTMGSNDGEPDERPTHPVSVSPFAIGKYEVTNEEYERFDPTHRRCRDGFSWRDREPVIYLSWKEAAKYCNWLSRQTGLAPVYDEESWTANLQADGFRLPTEAEWEYVASGRGEGRRYPWGAAAPSEKYANCLPRAKALSLDPAIGSTEDQRAQVAGSFPAGASRDGVMDLAGNACEWCADYYHPYSAGARQNPCNQTPSAYRVIRGGSFGYYNGSQRCADREFNNPGYPGYIYIGFRVALPEAGWRKVKESGTAGETK